MTKRICFWLMIMSGVAMADLIDFENAGDYGGDNAAVSSKYYEQYGVKISAMAGSSAADATNAILAFEQTGSDDPNRAFVSGRGVDDTAYSGDMGQYFLKAGTGGMSYAKSKYFVMTIDYNEATTAASGEVWDIDGPEQYTVTAFDSNGNLVASLVSPTGGLNAAPWTWSFDMGDKGDIDVIQVAATGEGTLRGFAFDNFNANEASPNADTHATPLPSAFALGLFGLVGLVGRDRSRRLAAMEDTA